MEPFTEETLQKPPFSPRWNSRDPGDDLALLRLEPPRNGHRRRVRFAPKDGFEARAAALFAALD